MIWKDWCGRKDKKGWTRGIVKTGGLDTNTVIPIQPPVLPILPLQPILRIHSADGSYRSASRVRRRRTPNPPASAPRLNSSNNVILLAVFGRRRRSRVLFCPLVPTVRFDAVLPLLFFSRASLEFAVVVCGRVTPAVVGAAVVGAGAG